MPVYRAARAHGSVGWMSTDLTRSDGAESFFGGSGGGLAKLLPGGAGSAHDLLQAVLQFRLPEVRYYADERALLGAARQQGRVRAAVSSHLEV